MVVWLVGESVTRLCMADRDLSDNQLSGSIPAELGKCTKLTYL